MLNLFRYKVIFWDDVEKNDDDKIEYGLVQAATYSDALEKVVDFYGEDILLNIELSFENDLGVIATRDKELLDTFIKGLEY